MPRSWACRGTCLNIERRQKLGVDHDVPVLTTASQAGHAPRLAPNVDAHGQPPDEADFERIYRGDIKISVAARARASISRSVGASRTRISRRISRSAPSTAT
jgi:hypothetical protein